ncbi:MAG: tetratricopeptide repeat protein [Planctomycetota bacterium]|nr:MAG: tetratricopeptide repeat protein [Planctomycetota bacterium]
MGAALVLALAGGGVFVLRARAREAAKQQFLAAVRSEPPRDALRVGEELEEGLRTGDAEVREALQALRERVAALDRRAEAEKLLAGLSRLDDLEARLALCTQAIEKDPDYARAYVERARVRFALARREALRDAGAGAGSPPRLSIEEPLEDLGLAVSKDPNDPAIFYVRADLRLMAGRDPDARSEAKSDLRRVERAAPDSALAALAAGRRKALENQFAAAIADYDRAIEKDPGLIDAYLARAEARANRGDFAGALSDATLATENDAGSARAFALRAEARAFAKNDIRGARADIERALRLDPALGAALALRSYVRLERDRDDFITSSDEEMQAALRDAQQALRLDDSLVLAHLTLAQVLHARGRISEAISAATKAVQVGEFTGHAGAALLCRARLYAQDGVLDSADLDLDRVLQRDPENARAMTIKASILVERKQFSEAKDLFEQAIERDPNLHQAYFGRGYLSLMVDPRNYTKAIEDFSQAIGLRPDYADAYFYRGVAYHDRNRFADAIEDMKRALELRETKGKGLPVSYKLHDLYNVLGTCHYHRQEWALAKRYLEEYVKLAPVGSAALTKVRTRLKECEKNLAGQKR